MKQYIAIGLVSIIISLSMGSLLSIALTANKKPIKTNNKGCLLTITYQNGDHETIVLTNIHNDIELSNLGCLWYGKTYIRCGVRRFTIE
jgi:hypothetical protein